MKTALQIAIGLLVILLASVSFGQVTGDQVCRSFAALNRGSFPGSCDRVAEALNRSHDPATMLAIAIVESDLRPWVFRQAAPETYDIGLMGIRCRMDTKGRQAGARYAPVTGTGSASTEATATGNPKINPAHGKARVSRLPPGRCTNGKARGFSARSLLDPVVNVRIAITIAEEKRRWFGDRWLAAYSGALYAMAYTLKVRAVQAALDGRRVRVQNERIKKICELLRKAFRDEKDPQS